MAETWVINEKPIINEVGNLMYNIAFTSESTSYKSIMFRYNPATYDCGLWYSPNLESVFPGNWLSVGSNCFNFNADDGETYINGGWIDQAYRTITFETAPTGDLLTWLQANGTLTPPSSPSTADKLQDLIDIKQDIKEAIENKGADLTGVEFSGYAGKIDEIPLPKEEQEVTVDGFIFSSGDVVVTPSTGKVMTKVTVVKDNDLIPENIVKNVNIFGVVGTVKTAVELTQAQYDALSVYDANTYYLIVEEE